MPRVPGPPPDVDAADYWGKTALMRTSATGYADVVRLLVEEGKADQGESGSCPNNAWTRNGSAAVPLAGAEHLRTGHCQIGRAHV